MKKTKSNYLLVLIFLAIGCSTSKKSMVNSTQENNYEITFTNLQKGKTLENNKKLLININANATESSKYKRIIDNQFRELEKLELGFAKISYDKKDNAKYDCEIEILFDELTINDDESTSNKQYSRKIREDGVTPDEHNSTGSVTVIGYVHQIKKIRKLKWDINMKVHSDSNHCKSKGSSFTENFISRSVNNTLSGDERAISKKYKESIEEPLLSKKDMIIEVIDKIYKEVEDQLKSND